MTATDTTIYRQRLLDERERLTAALEFIHSENSTSLREESEETTMDNHLADTATVMHDREVDYTLEGASEQVLAAIDAALGRLDAGTYGTCATCGRPIGEERLEAMPYATQCIDCRRREERG
jgi:RNA polymerase-binding protein DksA